MLIACSWLQLQQHGQDLHYNHYVFQRHQLHTNFLNVLPSTSTSSQPALMIILPQLCFHLEFVNPDFSTPYGITFDLLHSVVIVIPMLLSHLIRSSTTNNAYPTHHRLSLPFPTLTPIPMLPTPNELLTPIPPDDEKEDELPYVLCCVDRCYRLFRLPDV